MIIAVDIGNSSIKLCVEVDCRDADVDSDQAADQHKYLRVERMDQLDPKALPKSSRLWCICSVNQQRLQETTRWVKQNRPQDRLRVITAEDIPISTNVDDRQQIGLDRLVAAWGACQHRSPGKELVVVDAGTAVTIDLVDAKGVFQGGVIYPGLGTAVESLKNSTCQLPDLSHYQIDPSVYVNSPIGKNTKDSILSGIVNSQLAAVRDIVHLLSVQATVVATGGQSKVFQNLLPKSWIFDEHLVVKTVKTVSNEEI